MILDHDPRLKGKTPEECGEIAGEYVATALGSLSLAQDAIKRAAGGSRPSASSWGMLDRRLGRVRGELEGIRRRGIDLEAADVREDRGRLA